MTYVILLVAVIAIALFVRVFLEDFRDQRIRNSLILQLFVVGLCLLGLNYLVTYDLWHVLVPMGVSLLVFVVVVGFWLLGKMGAGDVKLLTVTPLLLGHAGLQYFPLALLVFTIIAFVVFKMPYMLPKVLFRQYITALAANDQVPFGMPISAAAIVSIILGLGGTV